MNIQKVMNQSGMNYFKVLLLLIVLAGCQKQREQVEEIQAAITIYAVGDSTMANKKDPEENPEHGWVQVLPPFFNDKVTVENHAVNGRSTRSFIAEGRWDSVVAKLKPKDVVIIQFGHNDQKENDPKRYTNPHTAYRHNLIKMVQEAIHKGARPILCSSIVRRNFNEEGTLVDTHGAYPLEVRLVAKEFDVPFVDMQYLTEQMEEAYGVEDSEKLHLHFESGEHPFFPEGKEDNTHLSALGANEVAKRFVQALKDSKSFLVDYFK